MADYSCFPTWVQGPEIRETVDPSFLPISDELVKKLMNWQATYDSILDMEDPASSEFSTPEEESNFEFVGWKLARALKLELPEGSIVKYFVQSYGKDYQINDTMEYD